MVRELETLIVERRAGVVTVTMNRPEKKNAANDVMWRELEMVFSEVAERSDDRVMVLTGAGDAFCSGADLGGSDDPRDGSGQPQLVRMRSIGNVALQLHRIPKPTVAKVGGVAAGAGMAMALGCDLVVASDDARFSQIFAKRGLSVDFGSSWLLPRMIGLHRAKELAFFADIISAADARDLGLVNRVVSRTELDLFVDGWATRLASGPPLALSMTKSMLNQSFGLSMEEALDHESMAQAVNFGSSDTLEALRAFLEKREPRFEGH